MRAARIAKITASIAIAALSVAALIAWLSYRGDQARFAAEAARVAPEGQPMDERAIALLHFVFGHHGFAKNKGYYLLPQLGPTPADVYERGGDCADKSRLLSAMLREIGVESTLAMCFDHDGAPTHTVVDAVLPDGRRMLLDPIWDLYFPRREAGTYYSLIDLRRQPELLFERLDVVTASAAPGAKIHRYNRAHDIYDHATTLNWDKPLTRWVRNTFYADAGDMVFAVPRPLLLEEPKLFVAALFAGAAVGLALLWALVAWVMSLRAR